MTRNAALLVATLGLVGCAEAGPLEQSREYPDQARIVCDEDGTTLETPTVMARADGIHLLVINKTSFDPGFTFLFDHQGGGRNTNPGGLTRLVETIPPGQARVGCWVGQSPGELGEPDVQSLAVIDPDGQFTAMELECLSGQVVSGSLGAPGADETSDRAALVEAARRAWAAKLADGDVVGIAGYPESPNETYVRVVRDGRVIARADYLGGSGRWGDNGYSACADEF